jgi:hypothetical protein
MEVEVPYFDFDNSQDVDCLGEWSFPQQMFIRKPRHLAHETGAAYLVETLEPARKPTAA